MPTSYLQESKQKYQLQEQKCTEQVNYSIFFMALWSGLTHWCHASFLEEVSHHHICLILTIKWLHNTSNPKVLSYWLSSWILILKECHKCILPKRESMQDKRFSWRLDLMAVLLLLLSINSGSILKVFEDFIWNNAISLDNNNNNNCMSQYVSRIKKCHSAPYCTVLLSHWGGDRTLP